MLQLFERLKISQFMFFSDRVSAKRVPLLHEPSGQPGPDDLHVGVPASLKVCLLNLQIKVWPYPSFL